MPVVTRSHNFLASFSFDWFTIFSVFNCVLIFFNLPCKEFFRYWISQRTQFITKVSRQGRDMLVFFATVVRVVTQHFSPDALRDNPINGCEMRLVIWAKLTNETLWSFRRDYGRHFLFATWRKQEVVGFMSVACS